MADSEDPNNIALQGHFISPLIHEKVRMAFDRHKIRIGKGINAIYNRMHTLLGSSFEGCMSASTLYYFWKGDVETSPANLRIIYKYLRISEPDVAITLVQDLSLSAAGDALSQFFWGSRQYSRSVKYAPEIQELHNATFLKFERYSIALEGNEKSMSGHRLHYRRTIADLFHFYKLGKTGYFRFHWMSLILPKHILRQSMGDSLWEKYEDLMGKSEYYRNSLEKCLNEIISSKDIPAISQLTGLAIPIPDSSQFIIISKDNLNTSSIMFASIFDQTRHYSDFYKNLEIENMGYEIYIHSANHQGPESPDIGAYIDRVPPRDEIENYLKREFADYALISTRIMKVKDENIHQFARSLCS